MSPPSTETPVVDQERRELLRLTLVPGVGPATLKALLDFFGSATRVTKASVRDLAAVDGVGPKTARAIVDSRREIDPDVELAVCKQHDTRLIARDDDEYPAILRQIHDPPPLLYCRGRIEPADEVALAIVGSRRSTPYGLRIAEKLARSLARAGVTIVSGLARGIDAAAHRGALKAGGRTIAVLANGLAKVYPPEHEELAAQVVSSGAIISEMPMRQGPLAGLFPQRNRVIAGLCQGVIVVEAAPRSGSLVTAQHALEQGREVFAVPGPIDSLCSRGPHQLIRDGAKLVETADDILEELRCEVRDKLVALATPEKPSDSPAHPSPRSLSAQELAILGHLDDLPKPADELISKTGLTASQVMATLSVLEVRRLIRRMPGNAFVRV
jgi:DNA processing protein